MTDDNENEQRKRQRARNLAVFFALLGFATLVYLITIVKIKLGLGL
jgi:hypothetical protein